MKKNQYIISSEKLQNVPKEFLFQEFGGYNLYKDPKLAMSISEHEETKVLVLGFIINPFEPTFTNEEIANKLAKNKSKEGLFKELENYSGRYVVFYKNKEEFVALTDFIAQRNIFYWFYLNKTYLFSCEKLLIDTLEIEPKISEKKTKMIRDKGFVKIKEHWFLGEDEWDDRFKKLLPNHFLDLNTQTIEQLPIYNLEELNNSQLIELSVNLMRGTIESTVFHFDEIYQALTAGYDSRLVLAASFPFKENIKYFLFDRNNTSISNDIKIAKMLSKKLGFKFETIKPKLISDSFKNEFENQFVISRDLSKHRNIQYFLEEKLPNAINISGDGGEILRNYRVAKHFSSIDTLLKNLSYQKFKYNIDSLEQWYEKSKNFRDRYGLEINDQFEIEVAMAKWAAKWALEQDFSGVEELTPYSNRRLIYSILLNTKLEERSRPDFPIVKQLMETMLPNSCQIPFNPPTWKERVKSIIKNNI